VCLRVRREGSDYIVEACVPHSALPASELAQQQQQQQPCSVKVGSGAIDRCAAPRSSVPACFLLKLAHQTEQCFSAVVLTHTAGAWADSR
jgi:hypothetical protein